MTNLPKITKKSRGKRVEGFDLLEITESLGYQIHRKNGRNFWSKEEDEELKMLISEALKQLGYPDGILSIKTIQESIEASKRIPWELLAEKFRNNLRNVKDLKKRWTGSLDPNLKKGRWTKEEDEQLIKSYERNGPHWLSVSLEIAGRTEDQCAKRYIEVLGPCSKGRLREWTLEEDLALISKVKAYGTKWRKISSEMEFRPSLTCRNRWRKIITMVVRNQASNEIKKAVKENKDLDFESIQNKVSKNNSNSSENTNPNALNTTGSSLSLKSQASELLTTTSIGNSNTREGSQNMSDISKSEPMLIKQLPPLSDLSPSLSRFAQISQPQMVHNRVDSPLQFDSFSALPKFLTNGITVGNDNNSHAMMKPNNLIESIDDKLMKSPDNLYQPIKSQSATNITSANLNNTYVHDLVTQKSTHTPLSTQTEWKFTLKDSRGLSISNGTISSSELIRELVQQAEKYSLKISVHQHVHNHYGSHGSRQNVNSNSPIYTSDQYSGSYSKHDSISSSSNSKSHSPSSIAALYGNSHNKSTTSLPTNFNNQNGNIQNTNINIQEVNKLNNKTYEKPYSNIGNEFLSKSNPTNYNSFELGFSPNIDNKNYDDHLFYPQHAKTNVNPAILAANIVPSGSATNSPQFATNNITYRVSPQSTLADGTIGTASTTPSSNSTLRSHTSELPDVSPSRMSHFNHLPPTIKPQLGSSENTSSSDLNKILNPSPLSSGSIRRKRSTGSHGSRHKHVKMMKKSKSFTSGEIKNTETPNNINGLSAENSTELSNDSSPEDGIDFWEILGELDKRRVRYEGTHENASNDLSQKTNEDEWIPPSEEEDSNDPFYYLNPS